MQATPKLFMGQATPKLAIGKTNQEERLNFVKYWADYVRTHSDKEWSRQQNVLINSQLRSAKQLSPHDYLSLKGEKCTRRKEIIEVKS